MAEKRYAYAQPCSRCGGTGDDPEIANCRCDVCEDGIERLELTEAEAVNYPDAHRVEPSDMRSQEPKNG